MKRRNKEEIQKRNGMVQKMVIEVILMVRGWREGGNRRKVKERKKKKTEARNRGRGHTRVD